MDSWDVTKPFSVEEKLLFSDLPKKDMMEDPCSFERLRMLIL